MRARVAMPIAALSAVGLAVTVFVALVGASRPFLDVKNRLAPPPLARAIAGVRVGQDASTDSEVAAALGSGLFVKGVGHAGARYFTDPSRSVTLCSIVGPDHVIEGVELTRGVSLPKRDAKSRAAAVSTALSTTPVVDEGLRLGMSARDITARLGRPERDKTVGLRRTLSYSGSGQDDSRIAVNYEATFTLLGDRLTRICLYDG